MAVGRRVAHPLNSRTQLQLRDLLTVADDQRARLIFAVRLSADVAVPFEIGMQIMLRISRCCDDRPGLQLACLRDCAQRRMYLLTVKCHFNFLLLLSKDGASAFRIAPYQRMPEATRPCSVRLRRPPCPTPPRPPPPFRGIPRYVGLPPPGPAYP